MLFFQTIVLLLIQISFNLTLNQHVWFVNSNKTFKWKFPMEAWNSWHAYSPLTRLHALTICTNHADPFSIKIAHPLDLVDPNGPNRGSAQGPYNRLKNFSCRGLRPAFSSRHTHSTPNFPLHVMLGGRDWPSTAVNAHRCWSLHRFRAKNRRRETESACIFCFVAEAELSLLGQATCAPVNI